MKLNRTTLKAYFERGDKPTQQEFANLIDSIPNFIEDKPVLKVNGAAPDDTGNLVIEIPQPEPLQYDAQPTQASTKLVNSGNLFNTLKSYFKTTDVDSAPIAGSEKLVRSGGVKTELDKKVNTADVTESITQGSAKIPTAGSVYDELAKKVEVEQATQKLNPAVIPDQDYEQYRAAASLDDSDIGVLQASDKSKKRYTFGALIDRITEVLANTFVKPVSAETQTIQQTAGSAFEIYAEQTDVDGNITESTTFTVDATGAKVGTEKVLTGADLSAVESNKLDKVTAAADGDYAPAEADADFFGTLVTEGKLKIAAALNFIVNLLKNWFTPTIKSVSDLQAFNRLFFTQVRVTDEQRGIDHNFKYVASGVTANDGTIYPANGGGFWVMQNSNVINAKWFNPNGNGIAISTLAIQRSIAALQDGFTYILPYGVYVLDQSIHITQKDCDFYFSGSFKLAPGILTPYGLIKILGSGCNFYDLAIDGNRDNALDEMAYGISGLLQFGVSVKNIRLYRPVITNSKYTAVVYDGKTEDIYFEGAVYDTIGEHCHYVSGGLNKRHTHVNTTVKNIGLQSNGSDHEGYFIKSRGDSYGNNAEFTVKNFTQEQTILPPYYAFFMDIRYCDNATLDDIRFKGKMYGFIGSSTTGTIRINKLDLSGIEGVYGSLFFSANLPNADITVDNSIITGYHSALNIANTYNNCIFKLNNQMLAADIAAYPVKHDVVFSRCTFVYLNTASRFTVASVQQNYRFLNCRFKDQAGAAVNDGLFKFGQTAFTVGLSVEFDSGEAAMPNFATFCYGYNLANLRINNVRGMKNIRGAFNNLELTNLSIAELPHLLNATYVKGLFNNVYQGLTNRTRYVNKFIIPSGATVSSIAPNVQYETIKAPVIENISVTPLVDIGSVRYWAELVNNVLTVKCTPAPTSEISFKVVIEVYA